MRRTGMAGIVLAVLGVLVLVADAQPPAKGRKKTEQKVGNKTTVPPGEKAGAKEENLARAARTALRRHCLRCHNGPGSEGGDFDVLNVAELRDGGLIEANKPDESFLYRRVIENQMPPKAIPERPSAAEGESLRRWLAAGAPAFPQATTRPFISLTQLLTAVRDHLRTVERDERQYQRYFTLHNLYNHPAILDEDLPLYRAALSKAINSLSWKPRIVVPRAVDAQQTLLVIDVRDLDWDKGNLWNEILRKYPYGLKYGEHPDTELRRLDEDIAEHTGCGLPVLRADWFVANATRPPLYHTLLGIPRHAHELERRLDVDVVANFLHPKPERIARAGFAKSGVSGQNRMVERHGALYGAYWKSYDFKGNNGRAKLTRFPLGPLNLFPPGKHPYPFQAFVHDGGELIFHLPNGLQAYMLIDGAGGRIDEGPVDVVNDPLKTSSTPLIVNGLSCMACHKHGVIRFQETLRASSAVFGGAEQAVRQLYPPQDTWDNLLEQDEQKFITALDQAIGPFLRVGANKNSNIKDFSEPVGEVARLHTLVFLDLQTIASELDLQNAQEIRSRVGEKRLKQLGLEPLLRENGVVSRAEWEAIDGVSLMQELARELRFTPYRPL